jgi:hypothetical protein
LGAPWFLGRVRPFCFLRTLVDPQLAEMIKETFGAIKKKLQKENGKSFSVDICILITIEQKLLLATIT